MDRGYVKIWRKVKDSGLFQLPNTFTLFVYMLTEATHKPIRFGLVDLERGQLCTGRLKLAFELKMTEQVIRTSIDHLQKLGMITSKSTNKYTVYTIVNYNNYQDCNQQVTSKSTNKQPTSNQQVTTIQEHKHTSTQEIIPAVGDKKRSTRLTDDFWTNEVGSAALIIRADWCNDDVISEFECFKDYWIAQPGQKGVKTDWMATWRNWCRRSNRKGSL